MSMQNPIAKVPSAPGDAQPPRGVIDHEHPMATFMSNKHVGLDVINVNDHQVCSLVMTRESLKITGVHVKAFSLLGFFQPKNHRTWSPVSALKPDGSN